MTFVAEGLDVGVIVRAAFRQWDDVITDHSHRVAWRVLRETHHAQRLHIE